jgi:hypothetical protein
MASIIGAVIRRMRVDRHAAHRVDDAAATLMVMVMLR